jgi:phosphoribosylamine--glycine ligase
MRVLGIGETNDLAAMYLALQQRGHEVKVYIRDEACHDVYAGLLQRVPDWSAELGWLRGACGSSSSNQGCDSLVLFETATQGPLQDALRAEGFRVVGGSAMGDRLEADRSFGQEVLRAAGLPVARCMRFASYADGIAHIGRTPARLVLKFNGAGSERTRNYVGQADDGSDVAALLQGYAVHAAAPDAGCNATAPGTPASTDVDYVLMDHLEGVEVGVGAYFNGEEFMQPVCMDFEHKRFFPGDLGELTGEMGTIVTYRGGERLFNAALAPLAPVLREGGYCGYINVNLIANERGLWPLEFTSRFGYPGFAICGALHTDPWDVVLQRLACTHHGPGADRLHFGTRSGFAAGVVLTVPPFPYRHGYAELSKGTPLLFAPGMTGTERADIAWGEVALEDGHLVASGACGYLGVALGRGETIAAANDVAVGLARKVVVPNLRYRTDIGQRLLCGEWARLQRLGWVASPGTQAA